jgi:AcrR family transcriptional regulator
VHQENQVRKKIGLERRARTQTKLLNAAARVLAAQGEKRVTIDDFIRAAGVARGTFYNYYKTRDEILDDLWAKIGRNPFLEIQQICAEIADPAERLIAETRLVLARSENQPAWGWIVYAMSSDDEAVNDDLLLYPRPDLEIGRRGKRFRFDNLHSANDLVVGTVRTALKATLLGRNPPGYCENICFMLLRALGIDDDEAVGIVSRPLPAMISKPIG